MHHTLHKILTRKYLVISVAALLLYALVGFVVAPLAIRWYLPKYAQQNRHCLASVGKIRINPFLLTLEINRFSLNQADASPIVAFERLFVDLEMSGLFHWAVVLKELELEKPDIHVVIEPDGSINFEKLATTPPQLPESRKTEAQPLPFICQSVTVKGGQIGVVNKLQSTPANFTLKSFDLQLMDLSTVKDHNGTYHLAATTEAGESFQWDGEIALAPLRSKGKLSLNAIQVASLWQFFRDSTHLEQPVGTINFSTEYRLVAVDNAPVRMTLEGLHVSFADLSLKQLKTDKPFFQLKKLALDGPRFDLATKALHIGRLLVEDGFVDARISESGEVNLEQIIRESRPKHHQGKETPILATQPSGSGPGAEQNIVPSPPLAPDPPLKIQVDAVEVKNIALDVDDKSRIIPFKAAIAGVDLRLQAVMELGANANSMVFRDIASELRGASVHSSQEREPLFAAEMLSAAGQGRVFQRV